MLHKTAAWLLQVLAAILILQSCGPSGKNEYRLLTVKDDLGLLNINRFHSSLYIYADSAEFATMPVRNGDLLDIWKEDENLYIRYSPEFPDTVEFRAKNGLCYINDKLTGISIYPSLDSLQLFRQLKENDLKDVQTVSISNYILEEHLPFLDSLSKINPDINLLLSFNIEDSSFNELDTLKDSTTKKPLSENRDSLLLVFRKNLNWLAERFEPKMIAFNGQVAELKNLATFKTVETLDLEMTDNSLKDFLPSFPRLTELIIVSDSDSMFISSGFLALNPQLEQLTINGSIQPELINWKELKKLRALRIFSADTLYAYPYGKTIPNLQTLQLSGNGYPTADDFSGFKNLKELGLPASVPQEIFNKIIETQPNLEFLQIIKADTLLITDYAALQKLKDLRYLVISGESGPAKSLYPMKKLKYLTLPDEFFEDSLQVNELKKSLPETVITPNSGVCMGSGWLLILIPLVTLGVLAGRILFLKQPVS
jgi:hypothetical protein